MRLPDHIRAFLDGPTLAVLAPVGPEAQLRTLQRHPHAAVVVVDPAEPYWYVQVRGPVRLDAAAGARNVDRLSFRYRGGPYRHPHPRPRHRVSIRLRPDRCTAMGLD
jgi:hypothetical protein